MKTYLKSLIYCIVLLTTFLSCGKDEEDAQLPRVKTKEMSAIRTRSATSGGIVESAGSFDVTQRGICWGINSKPTLLDAYTIDSSGLGGFNSTLTGLNPNTEYYVRAYAINNAGISYGNEVVFRTQEEVIPSENFWYVATRPFIVNALGTLWTSLQKSLGAISTEGGGVISIIFKDKPTATATYKVVSGTTRREDMNDDECSFIVLYPGFAETFLFSSGKTGNTINVNVNSFGKVKVNFNEIELAYTAGGEDKFTTTTGILFEK